MAACHWLLVFLLRPSLLSAVKARHHLASVQINSAAESRRDKNQSLASGTQSEECQVFVKVFSLPMGIMHWSSDTGTVADLNMFVRNHITNIGGQDPGPTGEHMYRVVFPGSKETTNNNGVIETIVSQEHLLLRDAGLQCGQTINIHGRGPGGLSYAQEVDPRALDWVVELSITHWDGNAFVCTGNLFASSAKVLTAGHCLWPPRKVKQVVIYLPSGHAQYGSAFYVHPDFNGDRQYGMTGKDMGMIEYLGGSLYGGAGKHRYLGSSRSSIEPYLLNNTRVVLAGYGATEDQNAGGTLRMAEFRMGGCRALQGYGCAHTGLTSKTASCGGDSGGPWFIVEGGLYKIIGIHTGGHYCNDENGENPMLNEAKSDFILLAETREFWHAGNYRDIARGHMLLRA